MNIKKSIILVILTGFLAPSLAQVTITKSGIDFSKVENPFLDGIKVEDQVLSINSSNKDDNISISGGNWIKIDDDYEEDTFYYDNQSLSVKNNSEGSNDFIQIENGSNVLIKDDFEADTTIPDTNASSACSNGRYLAGNGSCMSDSFEADTINPNQTLSISNNSNGINDLIELSGGNSVIVKDDNGTVIQKWAIGSEYLINDTETLTLNESILNNTIDSRDNFEKDTTNPNQTLSVINNSQGSNDKIRLSSGGEILVKDDFEPNTVIPDTNASSACSNGRYLAGNGSCLSDSFEQDTTVSDNQTLKGVLERGRNAGNYDINMSDNALQQVSEIDASEAYLDHSLVTPNLADGQWQILDRYNNQDIIRFKNGGDVEIPNGNITLAEHSSIVADGRRRIYLDSSGTELRDETGRLALRAADGGGVNLYTDFRNDIIVIDDDSSNQELFRVKDGGGVRISNGGLGFSSSNSIKNVSAMELDSTGDIRVDGTDAIRIKSDRKINFLNNDGLISTRENPGKTSDPGLFLRTDTYDTGDGWFVTPSGLNEERLNFGVWDSSSSNMVEYLQIDDKYSKIKIKNANLSMKQGAVKNTNVLELEQTTLPTCDSSTEGEIRYNGSAHYGCDGNSWNAMY